jgi:hypothetical protein
VAVVRGRFTLPDANAHGRHGGQEPVYCVAFGADDVFGAARLEGSSHVLHADLWESYLDER